VAYQALEHSRFVLVVEVIVFLSSDFGFWLIFGGLDPTST